MIDDRTEPRDAGFTLMELVVATALGILVLLVAGGILVSSLRAQQNVTGSAQAAGTAQVLIRGMEQELRQASAVAVYDGATTDSQLLVARTETGSGSHDWECQAWFYDAEAEVLLHTTYAGVNSAPWGSSITNWIDLGSGLADVVDLGAIIGDTLDWLFGGADDGVAEWTLIAVNVGDTTGGGGLTAPVFTKAGSKSVAIAFEMTEGDGTPVVIATTASGRQHDGETNPTCF